MGACIEEQYKVHKKDSEIISLITEGNFIYSDWEKTLFDFLKNK
jgi:hypothetical protein